MAVGATSGHPLRYAYHKVTYTSILPGPAPTSLAQGRPSPGCVQQGSRPTAMGCTSMPPALLDVQPTRGGWRCPAHPGRWGVTGGPPHTSLPRPNQRARTDKNGKLSQRERERERLSAESDDSLPVAHAAASPTPLFRPKNNAGIPPDQKVSVRSTAHALRFCTYSTLHKAPRPATYMDGISIQSPAQRCWCRINPTHPHRSPAQR